jgi:predicted transcriptional regulator YdeE
MNVSHVEDEKGFNVIGIAIRTTTKEAIENGTIQKLWQEFFTKSIRYKIK